MRTKHFLSIVLFFILFGTINFHCKDCPDGLVYHLPVTLTPQRDTFNIGDTLWLAINFPKELTDEQAGIKNAFEDFDFRLYITSYRYDTIQNYTTKTFDLNTQIGADSIYRYGSFDEYGLILQYDGASYQYEGLIVLKESGVFTISFGTRYDDRIDPLKFDGQCDCVATQLYCITNNGENNNVELVSPYRGNSTFWEEQFRLSGGFAFVVR